MYFEIHIFLHVSQLLFIYILVPYYRLGNSYPVDEQQIQSAQQSARILTNQFNATNIRSVQVQPSHNKTLSLDSFANSDAAPKPNMIHAVEADSEHEVTGPMKSAMAPKVEASLPTVPLDAEIDFTDAQQQPVVKPKGFNQVVLDATKVPVEQLQVVPRLPEEGVLREKPQIEQKSVELSYDRLVEPVLIKPLNVHPLGINEPALDKRYRPPNSPGRSNFRQSSMETAIAIEYIFVIVSLSVIFVLLVWRRFWYTVCTSCPVSRSYPDSASGKYMGGYKSFL